MITFEEYDRVQIILGKKGKPRPKHTVCFHGLYPVQRVRMSLYRRDQKEITENNRGNQRIHLLPLHEENNKD